MSANISTDLEKFLKIVLSTPMDHPDELNCRWGAPAVLWGPPGIGKTARVNTTARMCDLTLTTMYLATKLPEDIAGIPMPDGTGNIVTHITMPEVRTLLEAKAGVLFLDEINGARNAMQNASLGVIQERIIAGVRIPGRIRILGAGNPIGDSAGGFGLSPPMANRILHINVTPPTVEEWLTYRLRRYSKEVTPILVTEKQIADRWDMEEAAVEGLIQSFMRTTAIAKSKDDKEQYGDRLYQLPPQGHPARGSAWASPRAWDTALRCVVTARCLDEHDMIPELIAGWVGRGLAEEWTEWAATLDLPPVEDTLRKGWRPDKRRLDVAVSVYNAAVACVLGKTDKTEQREYAILAWKLLSTAIGGNCLDVAAAPARALMRAGYTSAAGPDVAAACKELAATFGGTGLSALMAGTP